MFEQEKIQSKLNCLILIIETIFNKTQKGWLSNAWLFPLQRWLDMDKTWNSFNSVFIEDFEVILFEEVNKFRVLGVGTLEASRCVNKLSDRPI